MAAILFPSAAPMANADGILALLAEDDMRVKSIALNRLNQIVDVHWSEIATALPQIETLYEDNSFPHKELAALVASKVFYHLEEFSDALKYALGAGAHFDVSSKSEYVETLIAKAIDQYITVRVKPSKLVSIDSDEAMEVETTDTAAAAEMDPRLEAIVDRMFDRCFADGEYKQALGIALESRRLDRLRASIEQSGDVLGLLSYALGIALTRISQREFRHDVLKLLVEVYTTLANPDALAIAQCLLFLNDAKRVAEVLQTLLQKDTVEAALIAYQVAFDLSENQNQPFLLRIVTDLPKPFVAPAASSETGAESVALTATQLQYNDRLKNLIGILSGETASDLHLQFLYTRSKTDLLIITQLKDKLESRNSVTNSSAVIAHAMMQCGTTVDTFLRDNLAWLGRATHWAKFTATASIGVIHKGHRKESMKLLGSYLPSAGSMGSPYSEGGALYALGLIHANHGGEHVDYLLDALKNARDEVIQHGACLGLGLSAMATGRRDLLDELLNGVVYLDNAVAGEAAGIAMGLIMVGFGRASNVDDMLQFANDTKHEKIIRGIAMGIALSMLGQEEQADTMIEQLLRSKDPLLRYGGVYTVALAYVGTANNSAIRRLLHLAVSDVADDVRRAAVTGLGFVLCNEPARVPRVVSLLSESFNPYVRYGSAMAVGIACAGTGLPEALNLLFPMLKDRVDFVRQAAFIAIAMVLVQSNAVQEPRVAEYRTAITQAIELTKGGDTMTKMGALFGAGIIDAGGRNCTLTLRSPAGHKKMASIVGVAMFCQYWYWFPCSHFLSLAFTPTAVIGLNQDLQMPSNWTFLSNAKPSLFAYQPPTEIKKAVEVAKAPVAQLSVSTKGKGKKKDAMEVETAAPAPSTDKMEVDSKPAEGSVEGAPAPAPVEPVPEPLFERLTNPSRATHSQARVLAVDTAQRYVPLVGTSRPLSGFVMLRDTQPEVPEELIKQVQPKTLAPDEEEEANAPEPFEFTR